MKKILFFLIIFFPLPSQAALYARTQILMGDIPVTIQIKTATPKKMKAYLAMQKAFDKVKEIEKEVSHYIPHSPVNRIQNTTTWQNIPYHLFTLIDYSLELSEKTNGAFDITYKSKNKKSSYQDIQLDKINKRMRFKKPHMSALVLGVAKGYSVDQMSDLLKQEGFKKHLINAGGDIYASGRWQVSIRDPKDPSHSIMKTFWVKNKGVSTSGLYYRGAHIYNPKTKKPIKRPGSITIIAPTTTLSDGLDNAAFVLGQNYPLITQNFKNIIIIPWFKPER